MALNFEKLDTYQTWRADKVFTVAVTDIFTSATHGLVDNDRIIVYTNDTLPAPLWGEAVYYVKFIDVNTFYLALTPGGATINITTTGLGTQRFHRSVDYRLFTADAGTNILTSATHGFVDEQHVRIGSNSTPPSPLVWGVTYYIKYIDANTFYLSLSVGGDTIDITDTGTGTHWLTTALGYEFIKAGALVSNTTRAGEGILTAIDRLAFNLGDVIRVQIFIISGSFLALDELTTAHGGAFVIYGSATTVTQDTIVVDGIADSDSTADLMGAISVAQTTIYDSNYAVLPNLRYIRIDSEWICIISSEDETVTNTFTAAVSNLCTKATHGLVNGQVVRLTTTITLPGGLSTGVGYYVKYADVNSFYLSLTLDGANVDITDTGSGTHTFTLQDSLIVKRAMFGSTAATHADNASIYILSEDLPRAIIDEDIAQGWGLCSMASGKFEINCSLMLGRPDQASPSILLTVLDRMACIDVYIAGGVAQNTIFQSGVGWVDAGEGVYQGLYMNGANISVTNCRHYEDATFNMFCGTLYANNSGEITTRGTANIMTASLSSKNYVDYIFFANRKPCKVYRSWLNNQRMSASSMELDWTGVYVNFKVFQETVYFLLSGGDTTFRNVEMVDSQYDGGASAFAAGGVKYFIDCIISTAFGQFLAGITCIHQKTLTMSTVSENSIDIPNVNIRILDKNEDGSVDVTTDAGGDAETQEVTFYNSDVGEDLNPFKFIVNKSGWESKLFFESVTAPKVYIFVMDKVRQA
jgi:hypothetical protein